MLAHFSTQIYPNQRARKNECDHPLLRKLNVSYVSGAARGHDLHRDKPAKVEIEVQNCLNRFSIRSGNRAVSNI